MTETAESSKAIVADFLGAWAERDFDKIMNFFDDDSVYHNVPVAPITGVEGIRNIFQSFLNLFDYVSLDIVNIVGEPGLVCAERIDRFRIGEKSFDLPVHGIFVLKDGKFLRFSDYFDLATFEAGSGMKL